MTLQIRITSCLVCHADCDRQRDAMELDEPDDEGRRIASLFDFPLPKAAYRSRLAPDVCDGCWARFRVAMLDRARRSRSYRIPPYRARFFWAWVMDQLAMEATQLQVEARRLVPHLAEKARRGDGTVRVGPVSDYGPRKMVYRRELQP